MSDKKLYRSTEDRKICGICGGLSDYFNIDATVIRVIWVVLGCCTAGIGAIIVYFICAAIIPERSGGSSERKETESPYADKPSDEFDSYFKK